MEVGQVIFLCKIEIQGQFTFTFMGGTKGYLVIGDLGQNWLVIWWFGQKKVGDLVIPRRCGDGDLPQKIVVIWWFCLKNLGDLVIHR